MGYLYLFLLTYLLTYLLHPSWVARVHLRQLTRVCICGSAGGCVGRSQSPRVRVRRRAAIGASVRRARQPQPAVQVAATPGDHSRQRRPRLGLRQPLRQGTNAHVLFARLPSRRNSERKCIQIGGVARIWRLGEGHRGSCMSVGPGADPGEHAVSPQVT